MESKLCSHCKFNKAISLFYINKISKDGFSSWCRPCTKSYKREKMKQYRNTNINNIRKASRKFAAKFRKENPELNSYRLYRVEAKKRGLVFDLSLEQFKSFFGKSCSYCGMENNKNGLDRVDNTLGYIVTNVVSCCVFCNKMKMNHTVDEFLSQCEKIINWRFVNGL